MNNKQEPLFGIKTIDNLPLKYREAIQGISDERGMGDGFWIYLIRPWFNPELECRTIHEQTISDCISQLKIIVNKKCTQ